MPISRPIKIPIVMNDIRAEVLSAVERAMILRESLERPPVKSIELFKSI